MRNKHDIYTLYLDDIKQKLIARYDELGLRASGKYEKELEYSIEQSDNKDKLIIKGSCHSVFMEKGRRPGKMPPIRAIEQWIEVKPGLPAFMKEKKKSMAWAIARSIAKKGITVPNKFNKGEVIASVVDDFLGNDIYKMLDELGIGYVNKIASDIKGILKNI